MLLRDKAYHYGVMLGDGFFSKTKNGFYIMLKVIDKDFVTFWRNCIERMYGKQYSIYEMKPEKETRQKCYLCKVYGKDKVDEVEELTHNRTEIPNFVFDGDKEVKKSFIQGLMDSEGYITTSFSPIKDTHIGLYFANTSRWTKDFWHLFKSLNIEVSDLKLRKMKDGRKDLYWFKINILDYVNSGLSFNIFRKRRRLEWIFKILNDYTHNYKGRRYSLAISEKVLVK